MDHLVSETVEHYHEERPHQSLGIEPPVNRQTTETPDSNINETKLRIVCPSDWVGGSKLYALRRLRTLVIPPCEPSRFLVCQLLGAWLSDNYVG